MDPHRLGSTRNLQSSDLFYARHGYAPDWFLKSLLFAPNGPKVRGPKFVGLLFNLPGVFPLMKSIKGVIESGLAAH